MWALLAVAGAQDLVVPDINSQLYRPPIDAERTLWAESSGAIVDRVRFSPRVAVHYAHKPLLFLPEDGTASTPVVSDVLQVNVVAPLAYDRFRVALDAPLYLFEDGALTDGATSLGDLGIDARVTLFDANTSPFGLGLHGRIDTPTATAQSALGDPGVSGEWVVSLTQTLGDRVHTAGNLGVRARPRSDLDNVVVDDSIVFRAGGGYRLGDGGLSLDLAGHAGLLAMDRSAGTPVELLAGGWWSPNQHVALRAGVGRGLTEGVGAPLFRAVTMIAVQPRPSPDRDGDGLVDRLDTCVDAPEDRDGFDDTDGCPDPDNDSDGVLDVADGCPTVPEDLDGRADHDGCPDPSQAIALQVEDASGRVLADAVTTLSGAQAGLVGTGFWWVELDHGDYRAQAVADGYLPASVAFAVPYDGERIVIVLPPAPPLGRLNLLVVDAEGRPFDAPWTIDGQGGAPLTAGEIQVWLPAGTHTLTVDAPGFAPYRADVDIPASGERAVDVQLQRARVTLEQRSITLQEVVHFATGRATLHPQSDPLLDEVAAVLLKHPELLRVAIEGHTDARGDATSNLRLSAARATAVRDALIRRGVDPDRLIAEGFGEDRPSAAGDGPAAWDKNRRVELRIVERAP